MKISNRAFMGSVNRSYYDKKKKFHSCYVSDSEFGKKKMSFIKQIIYILIFEIFMASVILLFEKPEGRRLITGFNVNGSRGRIFIEDRINVLTDEEENDIIKLFEEIYEKTGMPVALYTDDLSGRKIDDLREYTKRLYYSVDMEENAMVMLFTKDIRQGVYCGEEVSKCLCDFEFGQIENRFMQSIQEKNLVEAVEYSWEPIVKNLGKIRLNLSKYIKKDINSTYIVLIFFGMLVSLTAIGTVKMNNDAYRYFKENPYEWNE